MSKVVINNAAAVLPSGPVRDATVELHDGVIAYVGPARPQETTDAQLIDARGGVLVPGFIDLHIHGMHRFLVDNGPDDLAGMSRVLAQYGVTGFMPTVSLSRPGEEADLVARLAQAKAEGAAILGFHLEGQFLSCAGALKKVVGSPRDPARVLDLVKAAGKNRVVFSISPEYENAPELIALMRKSGAVVFMTHTRADVAQTEAAIEAGARHATHFYDVFDAPPMTEPGKRPCGAVEAILADPRVTVDFILDGVHVDAVAVRLALACKGSSGVCLITDANVGAGLPPGRYRFGEQEVEFAVMGGPARLTENSRLPGGIAGSGLTMDRAVANAVKRLDLEIPEAVRMASANPAAVLGLQKTKGRIQPGFDADLALLDESFNVRRTWVAGRCVYERPAP